MTTDRLTQRIKEILRNGDAETKGEVRTMLEEDLGQSFSSRKKEINELIDQGGNSIETFLA